MNPLQGLFPEGLIETAEREDNPEGVFRLFRERARDRKVLGQGPIVRGSVFLLPFRENSFCKGLVAPGLCQLGQFQFCVASSISSLVKRFDLAQFFLGVERVDDSSDLLFELLVGLSLDKQTFSVPLEGGERVFQLHVIVAQKGEELDHSFRREKCREKFIERADGILRPFQLGVTDGHLELGLVVKRALWEVGDQAFEPPEGFLGFTLCKKCFSFPEEEGVIGSGRRGGPGGGSRQEFEENEEEKEAEGLFPSPSLASSTGRSS